MTDDLEVAWSQTAATEAAKAAQRAPASAPRPCSIVHGEARGLVAHLLESGGDWSCHALAEMTGLTMSQVNGAIDRLLRQGLAMRLGARKGGKGHRWRADPQRYRWTGRRDAV